MERSDDSDLARLESSQPCQVEERVNQANTIRRLWFESGYLTARTSSSPSTVNINNPLTDFEESFPT